ncbi:MAG: hypothetical protein IIY21_25350 [Clostridiales bacterium]|nr:hypothetical protein [Clostridiales bacterium]
MPRKKKTEKYGYLIDYVKEAALARNALRGICTRAIAAYKQTPMRNTYRENALKYKQSIANSASAEQLQAVQAICDSIPDATNDTVFNAVETFVSMAMGGAEQFEYCPSDKYLSKDSELVDRLSALAQYFHDDNHIDSLMGQVTRNMVLQGQGVLYLNPVKDGRFKVSLIDAWNKLDDPRYLKTNCKRYEGYTEITHWGKLKEYIFKNQKDYMLSTMNDVDQYLQELTGDYNEWEDEITEDLDIFKNIYNTAKYSESKSVDDKGKPVAPDKPGYKGDDVEVAYIWDTINDVYGIVVNRRFLVAATEHPYRKTVDVPYRTTTGEEKTKEVTVEIDSPMVTIPYLQNSNETYPTSPLFYCLDDFDAICSMESVMNHNFSIMAPITFLGTSYDAEQVSMLSQVAGQIAEGTMNTLQVMDKRHDMSAVISAIERREQRIKRMLGATDQYELSQMLGNRATASEVSTMSGVVSQRMNNPLANIEAGMSELIQKMFAMYIIFADDDELTFANNGTVSTVSKIDMLGRSIIHAKLKSQIKLQQQEQSRNALMVMQNLVGLQDNIINKEALITTLVPIITQDVVSRKQAESFVNQNQLTPELVEQLQQLVNQNSPEPPMFDEASLNGMNPEDIDQMSAAAQAGIAPEEQMAAQGGQPMSPDMSNYAMAQQASPTVNTGADNYLAGLESNNANPMAGLI